jgi:uncharacterized protein (TIGR04222 family)
MIADVMGWSTLAFMLVYVALILIAMIVAWVLPPLVRPKGQNGTLADDDVLAMINGGAEGRLELAVVRLLTRRSLAFSNGVFKVTSDEAMPDQFEQRVKGLPPPITWEKLKVLQYDLAAPLAQRLVAAGLWMDNRQARRTQWIQTSPYLLLLALGVTRLVFDIAAGRSLLYIGVVIFFVAVFGFFRWKTIDRATGAGKLALASAQSKDERLRGAPTREEIPRAVALFGTAVLIGTTWEGFHIMRKGRSSNGGSSSCASGCNSGGDSGCSGGGGD